MSSGELLLIIVIAIIFIGPKELPEIARHLLKLSIKIKSIIAKTKAELHVLGQEIGIDEIKNEVELELANEKAKLDKEITTIIDIYGNEHQVHDLSSIRSDKSKAELEQEVSEYNRINKPNDKTNEKI